LGRKLDNNRARELRWDLSDALAEDRTAETRAQDARLLGHLQLAILVLGLVLLGVESYVDGEFLGVPDRAHLIGYAGFVAMACCYGLTRIGYFRTSLLLSIFLSAYCIIQAPLLGLGPAKVWWMAYLMVPIILANTFLRQGAVILLIVALAAALLVVPLLAHVPYADLPLVFVVLSAALLVIGRRHNEALERTRRAELAQSRERYRGLLETVFEGVVVEQDGRVIEANPGAAAMFGYTAPDALPAAFADLIPCWGEVGEKAETGVEVPGRRADGAALVLEVVARPMLRGDEETRIVALRDITERREAERERQALQAQVQRSQKLESLGLLAGGMTHDFNNMLTAILGQAELMRLDAPAGSRTENAALAIENAARRAAELTQKLLGFARRGPYKETPFSLHELIQEVTGLLRRTLDRNIEIEESLDATACIVQGDASHMHQVVMNLTINSADAMPHGGRMLIATRNRSLLESDSLCEAGLPPGDYVELSLRDTGTGIDPEYLDRIFDPFFTTKPKGKGTGLGLAMAYGIVRNHHGVITVESEVGQGTVFRVYLPVIVRQTAPRPPAEPSRATGSGEVLLVDDEPDVRDAVGRMLERLGYTVTTATNGQEAVDIYRERQGVFRIVVLDMVMPVMDGASCFRALQAMNPGVRALLSTGYDINDRAQEVLNSGMRGYVRKPYRLHELAAAIDAALTGEPTPRGN
jgi:PAS domain S-box-containing protein